MDSGDTGVGLRTALQEAKPLPEKRVEDVVETAVPTQPEPAIVESLPTSLIVPPKEEEDLIVTSPPPLSLPVEVPVELDEPAQGLEAIELTRPRCHKPKERRSSVVEILMSVPMACMERRNAICESQTAFDALQVFREVPLGNSVRLYAFESGLPEDNQDNSWIPTFSKSRHAEIHRKKSKDATESRHDMQNERVVEEMEAVKPQSCASEIVQDKDDNDVEGFTCKSSSNGLKVYKDADGVLHSVPSKSKPVVIGPFAETMDSHRSNSRWTAGPSFWTAGASCPTTLTAPLPRVARPQTCFSKTDNASHLVEQRNTRGKQHCLPLSVESLSLRKEAATQSIDMASKIKNNEVLRMPGACIDISKESQLFPIEWNNMVPVHVPRGNSSHDFDLNSPRPPTMDSRALVNHECLRPLSRRRNLTIPRDREVMDSPLPTQRNRTLGKYCTKGACDAVSLNGY